MFQEKREKIELRNLEIHHASTVEPATVAPEPLYSVEGAAAAPLQQSSA